jgi:hypothetical protein
MKKYERFKIAARIYLVLVVLAGLYVLFRLGSKF